MELRRTYRRPRTDTERQADCDPNITSYRVFKAHALGKCGSSAFHGTVNGAPMHAPPSHEVRRSIPKHGTLTNAVPGTFRLFQNVNSHVAPSEVGSVRVVRVDTHVDCVPDDVSARIGGYAFSEITVRAGDVHPRSERNNARIYGNDAFVGWKSRCGSFLRHSSRSRARRCSTHTHGRCRRHR